ncbi:hypothetical protein IT087_04460, partial [Candidatus Uhrbacteria bacterium]|nr:hypothetical protein [Candidatus Uhrbacteria bacterium]
TAPAYKAFEGYLFQIAKDLGLPSGSNPLFAGTYFDEARVDKAIDKLIEELSDESADFKQKLAPEEKQHIKDQVSEMKRFLVHYRHTPAHYMGEPIETVERADQNVKSIYRIINETTLTLLKAGLVEINDQVH